MGRYLNTKLVTHLGQRKFRLYCKTSFLGTTFLKSVKSKQRNLSFSSERLLADITKQVRYEAGLCSQAVRVYCTSSREAYKAEAPIGVYQESRATFQLNLLGMRLGESFKRLSRHINIYFKQKDVSISPGVGHTGFVCTAQEPLGRLQRRAHSPRVLKERRAAEDRESRESLKLVEIKETEKKEKDTEERTSLQAYPGLQLFHISSIANRFGESYSYVANHINSALFTSPVQNEGISHRRSRKRMVSTNDREETEHTHMKASIGAVEDVKKTEGSSSCEEGYLHFARHINRYFGAKETDTEELPHHPIKGFDEHFMPNTTKYQQRLSVTLDRSPESKQDTRALRPKTPGLFHMSNLVTSFGENYAYMANHINYYFKGQEALEDDIERDLYREETECSVTQEKTLSFMQCLLHPTAIPSLLGSYLGVGSRSHGDQATSEARPSKAMPSRLVVGRRQAEDTTRVLLGRLQQADTPPSITACIEELNRQLIHHPTCKAVVWQEKAAIQLLKQRRRHGEDQKLQSALRETLALIGYVDPVKGQGIRVLSIDGGGTRGVVPLQVLKQLEVQTGKRVHELFDYMCGVSTGEEEEEETDLYTSVSGLNSVTSGISIAIESIISQARAVLAFMLGLAHISLEECEEMYRRFGSDVFRQNRLVGTMKMGWSHSYYDTETWEMILREKIGDRVLIKTARNELCPKVSAVSAVVNWGTSPKAFVFRNYNHSPGRLSRYAGGSGYQLWQAVRASSAAPGYFQEFPLHSDIHQDGGLILNNPCALAVHECRLLWPNQPFQCVLSLGTGRYDNARRGPATSTSLRAKISNLICSATDTEGVHTLLDDLLAANVYFRFNPMLSAEVSLDESHPGALDKLQADTQVYLDRNKLKTTRLCKVLGAERTVLGKTKDWINGRAWELQQHWVWVRHS